MKIKRRLIALAMSIMMVFGTTSICYATEANDVSVLDEVSSDAELLASYTLLDSAIITDTVDLPSGSVDDNLVYLNVSGYNRYRFVVTFRGLEGAVVTMEATSPVGYTNTILYGYTLPAGDRIFTYETASSPNTSGTWKFELDVQPQGSGKAAVALIQAYGIS